MSLFTDHLRTSARSLLRAPLASFSIVATLAVCIAATTAVFSIVNAILIRGLPYREPDRLAWVTGVWPGLRDAPFTLLEFLDLRQRSRTIDLAAYAGLNASLSMPDGVRRVQGMRISGNAFDILGVQPTLGRMLQPADDAVDAVHVVVVSYGFWQSQLGGRTDVLGEALQINGERYAIAGVLPKYFPMQLRNVDLFVPLSPDRDPRRNVRTSIAFLRVFGRLRNTATMGAGERELGTLMAQLRADFPDAYATRLGMSVVPMRTIIVGDNRLTLLVLLSCVGLMLAIALANILNLLLIRATTRHGEIAVRRALGASPPQLALGLLAEGVLLAGTGSVLGILLAYAAVHAAVAKASGTVPRLEEAHLDGWTLVVATLLAVVATALFSVIPLFVALRTQPQSALRAASRTNAGTRGQARLRGAFIISEIALALVLTTATAGLAGSLARLEHVDLGYRTDSVFVSRLSLPAKRYATGADLARFESAMADAIVRQPGVVAAGAISIAPLSGALANAVVAVVGRVPASNRDWPTVNYRGITPGYFAAIRAKLVAGRPFDVHDDENAAQVVIINRAAATRIAGGDAVGKQLMLQDNGGAARKVTIVGVVDDMHDISIDGAPTPGLFVPMPQLPRDAVAFIAASQFWTVRIATDPSHFAASFLAALKDVDPEVATAAMGPLQNYVDRLLVTRRFSVTVLLGFALISLVLATLGVYGVMAYGVEQRRREIGVRLALGASPGNVVRLVLGNALGLSATGVMLGVLGALVAGRSMAGLLFGVSPGEPLILAGASGLLLAASLIASWIPAGRAGRIDPLSALSA